MTSATFDFPEDYAEALEPIATNGNVEQATSLINDWRSNTGVEGPAGEWLQVAADLAAQNNHPDMLRLLLENGAAASPMLAARAAKIASPEVFRVLHDHGWRPDTVGKQDKLPIILYVTTAREANPHATALLTCNIRFKTGC